MPTSLGRARSPARTAISSRRRFCACLQLRADLWCRRKSARISRKVVEWLRPKKIRTSDAPTAQTPPLRDLETWRPRRYGAMSRISARYAQLIRMCRRRGCRREDAKELVQEAHRRLFEYQRSTKVRDVDSLLRRIVINLSITYFHRELSTPFTFESLDRRGRRRKLRDPSPGPERAVAAEQQLDGVVNLLNAVSPRTCQIFLAQRGGYSYEEIATAFGVKPRTVEKHVASALDALREMMPACFAAQ
jgi:RNA polymerase sigma factor (sigma-70 family)